MVMIDFNKMIDSHLKKENKPKEVGRYYPSQIGTCLRKQWYSYKFPEEISPEMLKIFELGNIIHDFVVEVLKSEKNTEVELLKSEFPFKEQIEDFLVSGRVDNLILIKADGREVLVEVKSTKNVDFVNYPPHYNVMQLQLYMHFLKIYDGILLYVDKGNLKSKVFKIPYSEKQALFVIDRFRKLHKHLKSDVLPDPEARVSQETLWMCRFCEYREKCYKANPPSDKWM